MSDYSLVYVQRPQSCLMADNQCNDFGLFIFSSGRNIFQMRRWLATVSWMSIGLFTTSYAIPEWQRRTIGGYAGSTIVWLYVRIVMWSIQIPSNSELICWFFHTPDTEMTTKEKCEVELQKIFALMPLFVSIEVFQTLYPEGESILFLCSHWLTSV